MKARVAAQGNRALAAVMRRCGWQPFFFLPGTSPEGSSPHAARPLPRNAGSFSFSSRAHFPARRSRRRRADSLGAGRNPVTPNCYDSGCSWSPGVGLVYTRRPGQRPRRPGLPAVPAERPHKLRSAGWGTTGGTPALARLGGGRLLLRGPHLPRVTQTGPLLRSLCSCVSRSSARFVVGASCGRPHQRSPRRPGRHPASHTIGNLSIFINTQKKTTERSVELR